MDWDQYFKMMQDWKCLPAYKAEPRVDSLVGYYLPQIVSDLCHDNILGIIPELPIRLATVKPVHEGKDYGDKSYKVDFYLLGDTGRHYFIEFKTDSNSRRDEQDTYLTEAHNKGMAAIVDGITRIASVSSYKKKYDHLLSKLTTLGLINDSKQYIGSPTEIEIIYVQPKPKEKDTGTIIDFNAISEWLLNNYPQHDFERALAHTLAIWAID